MKSSEHQKFQNILRFISENSRYVILSKISDDDATVQKLIKLYAPESRGLFKAY